MASASPGSQPSPPRPERDAALASLLDAAGFARQALGSSQRAQRETLLALAHGTEADSHAIAQLLGRDRTDVARQLQRLERAGAATHRELSDSRHLYRLTAGGERVARRVRDDALARVQTMDSYDAFLGAAHPRQRTLVGYNPSPVRVPLPVGRSENETTGLRLQASRRAAGLTQSGLAEAAGISPRTLQRLEAGRSDPPVYALRRCAIALGLRLTDLLHPA